MRIDISNRIGTTSNFGGFRGLLDKFSGAAAGYSLRKLSKSATNAVRVRRSSDNTEQDIGFVGTELDTTTLLDFVNARDVAPADYGAGAAAAYSLRYVSDSYTGDVVRVRRDSDNAEADFNPTEITDGTLLAWVGNTASDNGYVTTWYDQSGNSNDASQGTAASQPKIVDAGVLVEENGKPALDFDGVDDVLQTATFTSAIAQPNTFFNVINPLVIAGTDYFYSSADGSNRNDLASFMFAGTVLAAVYVGLVQQSTTQLFDGANSKHYANGILRTSGNAGNQSFNGITIGGRFDLVGNSTTLFQEFIFYPSDQSSNRGNIEANVNDYYSIYTSTNDGFVTTWYDQSGNANNATQATAASQPQIVSSGSIITDSGYQVIQYDGSDDNLGTSFTATGTMLMGGADGGAFYEVAISGAYNLLASASLTDHPLRESIRVIWSRTLSAGEQSAIQSRVTYSDWDFSDVTDFYRYWRQRSELTSFPLIDTSSAISFSQAWYFCTSLQDFPANMFDSCTATNFTVAFTGTNLTQTSIDNILVSIDTAGQSGGTFTQSAGSAPSAVGEAAIDNLRARGWTVTVTGGY